MEKAVKMMYERLVNLLVRNLDFEKVSTILEAGCGSGQLTIPLVKKIKQIKPSLKVMALDLSEGPYKEHLEVLKARLREERLETFITPVKADMRNMDIIEDESIDLIVSNETLCELDMNGLEKALREF